MTDPIAALIHESELARIGRIETERDQAVQALTAVLNLALLNLPRRSYSTDDWTVIHVGGGFCAEIITHCDAFPQMWMNTNDHLSWMSTRLTRQCGLATIGLFYDTNVYWLDKGWFAGIAAESRGWHIDVQCFPVGKKLDFPAPAKKLMEGGGP